MIRVFPRMLGVIGLALLADLQVVQETKQMPPERLAWETKTFAPRPTRAKRVKNLDTASARQFQKHYKRNRVW